MFLKFKEDGGQVVEITEAEPEEVEEGYAVARSESFKPGDEFEYYIVVNETKFLDEEKDGDGSITREAGFYVISHSSIRQSPQAKQILQEIDILKRAAGIGGPGEEGIAQRLDEIEDRIAQLEGKS